MRGRDVGCIGLVVLCVAGILALSDSLAVKAFFGWSTSISGRGARRSSSGSQPSSADGNGGDRGNSRGPWKRFAQRPQNLLSGAGGSGSGSPAETQTRAVSARAAVRASLSSAVLRSLLLSAGFVSQTSLKAEAADGELECASTAAVLDSGSSASSGAGATKGNRPVRTKPFDERQFRAIELDNKLRVLLVSDPSSSRSAAAMDVRVGSFSDPYEVPGLAHFCEHMSFLGTSKYPKEDEFSSFLSSHGGTSNAYTDSEDTVYYFDVNADFTEEALDRFAQVTEHSDAPKPVLLS